MTNKRIYLTACLAIVAVFITCSLASALPALPQEWKIKFENWEYFNPAIGLGNLNNPDLDHDGDLLTGTNPNDNNAWEDNWGVAQITSVLNTFPSPSEEVWGMGDNNETIRMVYGGLDVSEWTTSGFKTVNSNEVNSFMSFYLHTEGDTGYEAMNVGNGPDDRIGMTGYKTVSDGAGVLLGTFNFVDGVDAADPNNGVLTVGSASDSNPPTGNGAGYLEPVFGSGTWADQILGAAPKYGDDRYVFMTFDFTADDPLHPANGWNMTSEDPITGNANAIPEPATLTLMGLGFIGMAAFARRKMSKKS